MSEYERGKFKDFKIRKGWKPEKRGSFSSEKLANDFDRWAASMSKKRK
jgi:hypothetical protein